MAERRRMAEQEQAQVLVAVGTDHHPFDRLVGWVDEWAAEHPESAVLIQRGTSAPGEHCATIDLLPHPELCERFARADVVISHGGPSTVMDARMAGRLPIVVPRDPDRGEHVDDHQQRFASHLKRHELAEVANGRAELHRLLDEATEFPERFSLPIDERTIGGVIEFGRVVDELLGTTTPVVPSSPANVAADAPAAESAVAGAESA